MMQVRKKIKDSSRSLKKEEVVKSKHKSIG
jgi:hypothetical protein